MWASRSRLCRRWCAHPRVGEKAPVFKGGGALARLEGGDRVAGVADDEDWWSSGSGDWWEGGGAGTGQHVQGRANART